MAKFNRSLTSITPHAPAEQNFVDLHRDNTAEPLNKDLANNSKNGINDASTKVKIFPRSKFHFGNDMKDSIAGYDERDTKKHATSIGHNANDTDDTYDHSIPENVLEAFRKDQLGGMEIHHTMKMNKKMDQQMHHKDDPHDPDRTGEISFHHAMRSWAARQRWAAHKNPDPEGRDDFKAAVRHSKFSKEMIKRAKDKTKVKPVTTREHLESSASVKDYIDDFQKSDNSRFAGKSAEERRKMAIGAWYGQHKEGEVVPISSNPKYKVKPHTRMFLNGVNKNNEKLRDFAVRKGYEMPKPKAVGEHEGSGLPWLRTIAEKKAAQVSENSIQTSDNFMTEKVAFVKSIVLKGK